MFFLQITLEKEYTTKTATYYGTPTIM